MSSAPPVNALTAMRAPLLPAGSATTAMPLLSSVPSLAPRTSQLSPAVSTATLGSTSTMRIGTGTFPAPIASSSVLSMPGSMMAPMRATSPPLRTLSSATVSMPRTSVVRSTSPDAIPTGMQSPRNGGSFMAGTTTMLSPRSQQPRFSSGPSSLQGLSSGPQYNAPAYPAKSWYAQGAVAPALASARGAPGRKSSGGMETYKASGAAPATPSSSSRRMMLGLPSQPPGTGTSAPTSAMSPTSTVRDIREAVPGSGIAPASHIARQTSRPSQNWGSQILNFKPISISASAKTMTPAKTVVASTPGSMASNVTILKADGTATIQKATTPSDASPIKPLNIGNNGVSVSAKGVEAGVPASVAADSVAQGSGELKLSYNGKLNLDYSKTTSSPESSGELKLSYDGKLNLGYTKAEYPAAAACRKGIPGPACPEHMKDLSSFLDQFEKHLGDHSKGPHGHTASLISEMLQAVSEFKGTVAAKSIPANGCGKLQLSCGEGKLNMAYLKVWDRGNRVDVNDRGGQIAYKNLDGTYDVVFDNGYRENFISADSVKAESMVSL